VVHAVWGDPPPRTSPRGHTVRSRTSEPGGDTSMGSRTALVEDLMERFPQVPREAVFK